MAQGIRQAKHTHHEIFLFLIKRPLPTLKKNRNDVEVQQTGQDTTWIYPQNQFCTNQTSSKRQIE